MEHQLARKIKSKARDLSQQRCYHQLKYNTLQLMKRNLVKMKGREQHLPDLHLQTSLEPKESEEIEEITGAFNQHCGFISCKSRLTKVLAGAAREETGSKREGGQVRLSDVELMKVIVLAESFRFSFSFSLLVMLCGSFQAFSHIIRNKNDPFLKLFPSVF